MVYSPKNVATELGKAFIPLKEAALGVLEFFRDPPPGQTPGKEWYLGELLYHILNGDVQTLEGVRLGQQIITLSSTFYGCDSDTLDKDLYESACAQLEIDIKNSQEPDNFIEFINKHLVARGINRPLPAPAAMKSFLSIATMIGAKLNPRLPPEQIIEQIIHNITLSLLRDGKIHNGKRLSSDRSTYNYGETGQPTGLAAVQWQQQAPQAYLLDQSVPVGSSGPSPDRSRSPSPPRSRSPSPDPPQPGWGEWAWSKMRGWRGADGGGRKKRRRNTRNTRNTRYTRNTRKKSIKQKRSNKRKKYTRKRSTKRKKYTRKRNTGRKKSRIHKRRVKDENLE